jgi:hypothetical protein
MTQISYRIEVTERLIYLIHKAKGHNLQKTNYYIHSIMIDKIRQLLLSILGVGAIGFVFYLVFKDDRRFMIGLLATLVGLIIIVLLVGLILRIRDKQVEKKRRKPFNP